MMRSECTSLSVFDTPEELHAYRKVPLSPANGVRIRDDHHNLWFGDTTFHDAANSSFVLRSERKRSKAAMLPTRSIASSGGTSTRPMLFRIAVGTKASQTSESSRVLRPHAGQYGTVCESKWPQFVHSTACAEYSGVMMMHSTSPSSAARSTRLRPVTPRPLLRAPSSASRTKV